MAAVAPSYQVRMAMGLTTRGVSIPTVRRTSGSTTTPVISLRPEVTGNKSKKGHEVSILDGRAECLTTPMDTRLERYGLI